MRLLVDLGNTRLKWAVSNPGWDIGAATLRDGDVAALLDEAWSELPVPVAVVAASVASQTANDALDRWVHDHWRVGVHRVRSQAAQLGVINRYADPTALGADRWAALLGARAELPDRAVCVVDCGTALTVDALTAEGEFVGGIIFPGLALLRQALAGGTARIRVVDGDESAWPARRTDDAVAAGALYGLAGAIERVCRQFEETLAQSMEIIITGGDAGRVVPRLTRAARHVPDLVFKGLDRIAATL